MESIVNKVLPFTKEDNECAQKKMIKERNRAVLLRTLTTLQADPYSHFKAIFEASHLSKQ